MKQTLTIAVSACILLAGCDPVIKPAVIPCSDNISLTIAGQTIMDFDPDSHQLGYNETKNEFRVSDDTFGKYFILRCSSMPSKKGEDIDATLTYTDSGNDAVTVKAIFNVYDMEDGLIHLWNQEKKIMATVKTLH